MGIVRHAITLAAAVACVAVGAAAEHWRLTRPSTEIAFYVARKRVALDQQADKAPKGVTLLVGDSITEGAWVPTMCGRPAFNAGISAARTRDMIRPARDLAQRVDPGLIIVALGTNDAGWAKTPIARFESDYEALLAPFGGRPLILVGLLPIEPARMRSAGDAGRVMAKQRLILQENAIIGRIAAEHGAAFVAQSSSIPTIDGVHPTPVGSEMWKAAIEKACPA